MIYTPSVASDQIPGDLVPEEYLTYIYSLISKLRGGDERFIPLLAAKLEQTSLDLKSSLIRYLNTPDLLIGSTSPPDYGKMELGNDLV